MEVAEINGFPTLQSIRPSAKPPTASGLGTGYVQRFQTFPPTKTNFLPMHSRGVPAIRAVRGAMALRHPWLRLRLCMGTQQVLVRRLRRNLMNISRPQSYLRVGSNFLWLAWESGCRHISTHFAKNWIIVLPNCNNLGYD